MAQVFESLKLDFSFRPKFAEGPRETLVFRSPKERLELSFRPTFAKGLRETFVFGGPRRPKEASARARFRGAAALGPPLGLLKTSVSRGPSANFGRDLKA